MRISNIQNFAASAVNMMDKCCGPKKSVENTISQNNLERSPKIDTVSFGNFGITAVKGSNKKDYTDETAKTYARKLFIKYAINELKVYEAIRDCVYLDVTTKDFENNIYEAELVHYNQLCSQGSNDLARQCDKKIKDAYQDFNEEHGLEEGWEKELHNIEDFLMLGELARHLTWNGYGPEQPYSDDEDAWVEYTISGLAD